MKTPYLIPAFVIISVCAFGQKVDPPGKSLEEPEDGMNLQPEYDSSSTWRWSDEGLFDEEKWHEFQERMEKFWGEMDFPGEDFMYGFKFEEHMKENFRDLEERFEQHFHDSAFFKAPWEDLLNGRHFDLRGFNFDSEHMEKLPLKRETLEEFQKKMQDLLDEDMDERIRKFIEEHKNEIDEIRYQIMESIPGGRKAI